MDAADAAPSESWEGGGSVGGWDQVKEMEEGEGEGRGRRRMRRSHSFVISAVKKRFPLA